MATISEMLEQLERMRDESHWNGEPDHLYTYYFDAIQALMRLERELTRG